MNNNLVDRAKKIECILLDVDGTLTDGNVIITEEGTSSRIFNIKDGLGLYIWKKLGFKTGIITGDNSNATKARAKMLNVDFEYYNCLDKRKAINEILETSGLNKEQIAFIGDDLIDIPVMKKVGLSISVKDGASELDDYIHYRTTSSGGRGAVREVVELILKAKNQWQDTLQKFFDE